MADVTSFSPDYATSRQRFAAAAKSFGWSLESISHELTGPAEVPLALDVAISPGGRSDLVVVVSSGLHGVEGLFGSAVQQAWLEASAQHLDEANSPRVVLLHGLNPWGFAWRRRFDHENIDPNRNFLLPGEDFTGSPAGYAELDRLLNPPRQPSRWESFTLKAGAALGQHGMRKLKQAICGGQFDYPRGLWFGGHHPSWTHRTLLEHLPRWLNGVSRVVHLDFHTGLGKSARWKLLVDFKLSLPQQTWLAETFGEHSFEANDDALLAYPVRGGFGLWCQHHFAAVDYLYLCAEFGTFSPLKNLAGLRFENQATHWCDENDLRVEQSRRRLQNLFVPTSLRWRTQALGEGLQLIQRAVDHCVTADDGGR